MERLPALPPAAQAWPTAVAGVMWGNLNLALVLFFSFAPGAMAAGGLVVGHAAAWTGAALWVVMLSVPLGAWAVQRSGRPDAAIVAFAALGSLALGLLPLGVAAAALALAFGVAIGPPAGAVMALPARVLAPEHRAGGLGVFMTCYYAILSAGPAAAGLARAAAGSAAAPLWFAAAVLASLLPLLGMFHALIDQVRRAEGLAPAQRER
jgi:MFS family permease